MGRKSLLSMLSGIGAALLLAGCAATATPSPTPSPSPTPTVEPTPSPTPTATPSPSPIPTPTPLTMTQDDKRIVKMISDATDWTIEFISTVTGSGSDYETMQAFRESEGYWLSQTTKAVMYTPSVCTSAAYLMYVEAATQMLTVSTNFNEWADGGMFGDPDISLAGPAGKSMGSAYALLKDSPCGDLTE